MIEEGCMEGVDEVYGIHNWHFDEGVFHVKAGGIMAGVMIFKIVISGRGGHGSEPASSVDPILPACQLNLGLQTIKS